MLMSSSAYAQVDLAQVKDVGTGGIGYGLTPFGQKLLFFSNNEVYASSTATTADLVHSFAADPFRPDLTTGFVSFKGKAFFASPPGALGTWVTTGVASGTEPAFATRMWTSVQLNDSLIFGDVTDLYVTDGTTVGTKLLKSNGPGVDYAFNPHFFARIGNTVVFGANDASTAANTELWKTDGTSAGTLSVREIAPGIGNGGFVGNRVIAVGNTAYFSGDDGKGVELWKTDGTADGTSMVIDLAPSSGVGAAGSGATALAALGNNLVFAASSETSVEIFKTDGTSGGTSVLASSLPLCNVGDVWTTTANVVYFLCTSLSDNSIDLFKTDGTPSGTAKVSLLTSTDGSIQTLTVDSDGTIYVVADNGTNRTLLRSNGSSEPIKIADLTEFERVWNVTPFNGSVYFFAQYPAPKGGVSLWSATLPNGAADGGANAGADSGSEDPANKAPGDPASQSSSSCSCNTTPTTAGLNLAGIVAVALAVVRRRRK